MPELPEVEVLARHLAPLLKGKVIHGVEVRRARVLRHTSEQKFKGALTGARFTGLIRRGKYLLFALRRPRERSALSMLGHLGMTGRMYLQPAAARLAKHVAVVFSLGQANFVFEDVRGFGCLTLGASGLAKLGPEPLSVEFTVDYFAQALKRSKQAVKVKLLDQSLVAGVGNIYASEALFRAGVSPRLRARELTRRQVTSLRQGLRQVLVEAIQFGSVIPLDWFGSGSKDRLFYYGQAYGTPERYEERRLVYDRAGRSCSVCNTPIRRIVQAARSTFYCPRCQRA